MGRLPFNPAKMAVAQDAPGPAALPAVRVGGPPPAAPLTVSQLAAIIDRAIRDHVAPGLRVVGEIGQFRERTHWYFDLKDAGAVIPCVMWQSAARKVGCVPEPGQQVLLTGRVEYYQPFGKTQFIADRLEPVGAGALDLAFRRLCDELRALGWFDESRKRPLPLLPRRLAVVTSRTGAALQDVLDTVDRRCPALPIALADVRVQGPSAAAEIARAVRAIGRRRRELGVDVILVTRGGGSREDLWAFNDRALAEAIVRSPVPVVAAVGHETDTTIAELVADLRAATPTQAAMRIAPDAAALRQQLASLASRLRGHAVRRIELDAQRLRAAARHPLFTDPARSVEDAGADLDAAGRDLAHAARERVRRAADRLDAAWRRLERHRPGAVYDRIDARLRRAESRLRAGMADTLCRHDPAASRRRLAFAMEVRLRGPGLALAAAARGLDLVGPLGVLRRGFSLTLRPDGSPLRSAADVAPGQAVRTRLHDGEFTSVVTSEGARPAPLPRARPRGRRPDDPGPGLFTP